MKSLTGGFTLFGTTAFLVTVLFYFSPTAEAVTQTSDSSQTLIQQLNQNERIQAQNQSENPTKNLSEAVSFRATAYCLQGRTAMGGGVRRGIVAADPRVLPLGSRIQLTAGAYSGTYTVADTGGSVRGRKLDIWVPSCSEARRFGSRSVTVSKLGKRS